MVFQYQRDEIHLTVFNGFSAERRSAPVSPQCLVEPELSVPFTQRTCAGFRLAVWSLAFNQRRRSQKRLIEPFGPSGQ